MNMQTTWKCVLMMIVLGGLASSASVHADSLLWWNRLGSVDEILNPPGGSTPPVIEGKVGFVPGVFGNAYAAVGHGYTSNRIIIPESGLQLNPEAGTIDAWVMYPQDPIVWAYHYSMFSMVDGFYQCTHDPTLGCQARNHIGDGVTGDLYKLYAELDFGSKVQIQIPDVDSIFLPQEWHHLALMWDRQGIESSSDCFRVYIDGDIHGATAKSNWGDTPDVGNRHTIGKGEGFDDGTPAFAIDNIKIWDYAALDAIEERFDEDYVPEAGGLLLLTVGGLLLRRR